MKFARAQRAPVDTDGMQLMSNFVQAKDVAAIANVDAKYFRSFLRDVLPSTPGMGGRYMIPAADVDALLEKFDAWRATNKRGATIVVNVADIASAE
jgi:hypothetical protein